MPSLDDDENHELKDFARRFWWTLPLTVVVFVLAMLGHRLQWYRSTTQSWIELALRCRSCCGRGGRSSSGLRSPSSTAAPTCGR